MRKVIHNKPSIEWTLKTAQDLAFAALRSQKLNEHSTFHDTVMRVTASAKLSTAHTDKIWVGKVTEHAILCAENKTRSIYHHSPGKQIIISKSATSIVDKPATMKTLLLDLDEGGFTVYVAKSMDEAMDWLLKFRKNKLCG